MNKFRKSIIIGFIIILGSISILFFHIHNQTKKIINEDYKTSSTKILDRNGEVLYEKSIPEKGYEEYKSLDEINPYFKDAFITMEDKDFYENKGIDIGRLFKCSLSLFRDEKCGASTITQQYVKLSLGNKKRGLFQKVEEILISVNLNFFVSKDEILERYLNTIYFGNMRYGVESASQGYFGKKNTELDLAQVTLLGSIPNSPTKYDPYGFSCHSRPASNDGINSGGNPGSGLGESYCNNDLYKRKNIILSGLEKSDKISQEEYEEAKDTDIEVNNYLSNIKAPHFVQSLNLDQGDLSKKIKTTLDLSLYEDSLENINNHLQKINHFNATNGAVVVLDSQTGETLVMVGSKDFYSKNISGQVNNATALHQPGSTLKPFIYAQSFMKGFNPATKILDKEQVITSFDGKPFLPINYDKKNHGWVSIREALGNSYNVPASVMFKKNGLDDFYLMMDNVGLEEIKESKSDIAAALGGTNVSLLDLTNAYRVFGNDGKYLSNPKSVSEEDKSNEKSIYSKEVSYQISSILGDNNARRESFGSYSDLDLPFPAAVKTGTATDYRDAWTIGYTKHFVVGVWVGNNDNTPMDGVSGVMGAAPIWNQVMLDVYDYYRTERGIEDFEIDQPEGIEVQRVCQKRPLPSALPSNTSGQALTKDGGDEFNQESYAIGDECVTKYEEELFIKERDNKINAIRILEPDLIAIKEPADGDEFYFEEGVKIKIEFISNSDFDEYYLVVDGEVVEKSEDGKGFWWELEKGRHEVRIDGVKNDLKKEGIMISIRVL